MRIGIDASRAFGGQRTGTENYSYQMIRNILQLPEAKRQEWVLYTRFKVQIANIEANSNIKIQKIDLPYLWTQVGLAARTWLDGLDVLWVPAHTLPVLRNPRVKTVVTIHGIEYEWLPAYENVWQRWYLPLSTKYAVAEADKIIAVSQFTKRQLVERLGAKEGKIEVVWEGVERRKTISLNQRGILEKYHLQAKGYLLFVGTVQPRKNLVRLIEAFSGLGGELRLVIAGKWGWGYQEVLEAPRKFGVEGKVVFVGYVDDRVRGILLENALVYVQPSVTEGFGLPIVEAWAMGVPVVSSWGGALREVVGNGGLLFDPMSVEEMAEKIKMAAENTTIRNKLTAAGAERVGEFRWDKAAIRTYNILANWN